MSQEPEAFASSCASVSCYRGPEDIGVVAVNSPTPFSFIAAPISCKIAGSSMVAGMVPLEQVRQFDAKRVSENGNDDPVEKQQNRSYNADAHDNADNQGERNSNDCNGILVCHRATMQPSARGRQG
jgi:hypothetical protein